MNNKKSQHEILGFVLIVVVVTVIGIIFLSLSIGKGKAGKQTSIEISNLLMSVMYYTTDCAVNFVPQYREGQDLIKECNNNPNQKCLNGMTVCESLNATLSKIIDDSLMVSEESPNKAYSLDIYYSPLNNIDEEKDILFLKKGVFANCSSILGGSQEISVSSFSSDTINVELELCRG